MTTVLPRHEALLPADEPVLGMKRAGSATRHFAFAKLVIDAVVLVGETCINLGAAGVILIPCLGVYEFGGAADEAECQDRDCNTRTIEAGEYRGASFCWSGVD